MFANIHKFQVLRAKTALILSFKLAGKVLVLPRDSHSITENLNEIWTRKNTNILSKSEWNPNMSIWVSLAKMGLMKHNNYA